MTDQTQHSTDLISVDDAKITIKQLKMQVAALEELLSVFERAAVEQTDRLEATIETLKRTQTQLIKTEKMSSLGMLMAGIAHEINNPITFITGNLEHPQTYSQDLLALIELYQDHVGDEIPEAIADHLEEIDFDFVVQDLPTMLGSMHLGTQQIQQLVTSLRNFSRLDATQSQEFNLHDVIDGSLVILGYRIKSSRDVAERPKIAIIKDYGDLPPINGYPGPLNQVLMNLVSNGIDALEARFLQDRDQGRSPQDMEPLELEIITELAEEGWVRIRVRDRGTGLPEGLGAKLFEPLFTTKAMGKGTGLGLSICRDIVVEGHGGRIEARSRSSQGAEFIVELPVQVPVSTDG